VPLRTVLSADPALAEAYGLAKGGAVLIRPDGHGSGSASVRLGSLSD